MAEQDLLAEQFERNRTHLHAVAYRMVGSLNQADDAVQEAWIRLSRSGATGVENLGGWLTAVVSRVCLDMLRARKARAEQPFGRLAPEPAASGRAGSDPEQEALLADSVGLALLVVLDTLAPAERLAFVLHDMFALPFEEISRIIGRSPVAVRQLASRARQRVRGAPTASDPGRVRQREVVDAYLAAARGGNMAALLELLDPNVVIRAALRPDAPPTQMRGAALVADRAIKGGARAARVALVNGSIGVVVAPRGHLLMVLTFSVREGKIVQIDAIADPARLRLVQLAMLGD